MGIVFNDMEFYDTQAMFGEMSGTVALELWFDHRVLVDFMRGELPPLEFFSGDAFGELAGSIDLQGALFHSAEYMFGDLELHGYLRQPSVIPSVAVIIGEMFLDGEMEGVLLDIGDMSGDLYLSSPFFGEEGDYFYGDLPDVSALMDGEPPSMDNYMLMLQSQGFMYAFGAVEATVIEDTVRFSEDVYGSIVLFIEDAIRLTGNFSTTLQGNTIVTDGFVLRDAVNIVFRTVLTDGFSLSSSTTASLKQLVEVADRLLLTGAVTSMLAGVNTIVSAITLSEMYVAGDFTTLTDAVLFSEAYSARLSANEQLVEQLLLTAAPQATLTAIVAVADSFQLGDSTSAQAQFGTLLRDGIALSVRLNINGEVIVGYVCNTDTLGFSTYTNFPFGSMANVGGSYFVANDAGVYQLGGDSDDGENINARLRGGMRAFGSHRLKRMPNVYLGMKTDGTFVLKAIITDEKTGQQVEHWYKMYERTADSLRGGRITLGRGLESRYYGWELVNADGADFELDVIEFFPMMCDRRM